MAGEKGRNIQEILFENLSEATFGKQVLELWNVKQVTILIVIQSISISIAASYW